MSWNDMFLNRKVLNKWRSLGRWVCRESKSTCSFLHSLSKRHWLRRTLRWDSLQTQKLRTQSTRFWCTNVRRMRRRLVFSKVNQLLLKNLMTTKWLLVFLRWFFKIKIRSSKLIWQYQPSLSILPSAKMTNAASTRVLFEYTRYTRTSLRRVS